MYQNQLTKKKLVQVDFLLPDFWVLKELDCESTINEKENKKLFDIMQSKTCKNHLLGVICNLLGVICISLLIKQAVENRGIQLLSSE